jgi:hypothetical protein
MRSIFSLILFIHIPLFTMGQSKMKFYEDTTLMKKEVLSYIPAGTPTSTAIEILKKNGFIYYEDIKDGDFLHHSHIDFLFLYHDETAIIALNRWQLAVIYKEDKVTDVVVKFVIIGL